jgi:hypothetical protein
MFNPLKKTNVHLGAAMVMIVWELDLQLHFAISAYYH